MEESDRYTIDDVAFIGRTVREYERMFDLDLGEWTGKSVLDCPGGACAFVPVANGRGIDAVGADVLYDTPPERLREKCEADVDAAIAGFDGVEDQFVWSFYDDVADVRDHWTAAYRTFVPDYAEWFDSDRYVHAELPDLPFADDSFSLVLSAHLMFLYSDDLSHEFHAESLRELARVADEEVRIYPLARFDGQEYPRLDELREMLADEGYATERRSVSFEFQRGADEMLRIEV
ncbi:class I SAM-dependent methyltransferase [Halorussus salilacus]|uniref:class I SAM-dependent methyltransferase n=1 Tax=Halorussus salilacus TaxID=2953750 RepID=UPI0020A176BD|nr:class I SAM-dependent methyltransferase [Halorussus salilacus]USZ67527.1 class I SAM-dependent methyltransferase [Halorussus salilacus]